MGIYIVTYIIDAVRVEVTGRRPGPTRAADIDTMATMSARAVLIAFLATLVIAASASAQDASAFGRASGGQIEMAVKRPDRLSGSLSVSASRLFKNYDAALGGTLVKDRVWFFGSVQRSEGLRFDPAFLDSYGKMNAQLGDSSSLTGSAVTLPSSFLSLHYTGVLSGNMFVTATVSRSSNRITP